MKTGGEANRPIKRQLFKRINSDKRLKLYSPANRIQQKHLNGDQKITDNHTIRKFPTYTVDTSECYGLLAPRNMVKKKLDNSDNPEDGSTHEKTIQNILKNEKKLRKDHFKNRGDSGYKF